MKHETIQCKNVKHKILLAMLLSGFTVCTLADGMKDIKPGLWEIQNKTAVDGQELPDMSKMLEQVPAEMRGQVEAMLAKNGAGMTDNGITVCITPEQIAKQEYGTDPKSQCKVTDIKNEDDTTHMKMQCSKPKGEGETTITRQSSEAWTSITRMTMDEKGSDHTMNTESAAKWIGSSCGVVKPEDANTTAE